MRWTGKLGGIWGLVVVLGTAGPVLATDEVPSEDTVAADPGSEGAWQYGRSLFEDLDYEGAVPPLTRALEDETLAPEHRAGAAVRLGVIRYAGGDVEGARGLFVRALELFWDVSPPPYTSPKIVGLFHEVKATRPAPPEPDPPPPPDEMATAETPPPPEPIPAPEPPKGHDDTGAVLRHVSSTITAGTLQVDVAITALGAGRVHTVTLFHRRRGESIWADAHRVLEAGQQAISFTLPAPNLSAVELYLAATAEDGRPLGQAGSAAIPFIVRKTAEGEDAAPVAAVYRQWWFWTGVGVVVTAVAVGIVLGAQAGGCPAPDGEGCLSVTVQ